MAATHGRRHDRAARRRVRRLWAEWRQAELDRCAAELAVIAERRRPPA